MGKKELILSITLLAVAVIVWFLLWPAYSAMMANRENLGVWQAKYDEARKLKAVADKIRENYDKLSENSQKAVDALTGEADIPSLLTQLEDLTSQNGLILNSINFSPQPSVAPMAGVKTLDIDLNLAGDFNSLMNFIDAVENNLRIMDVSAVNFQPETGGSLTKYNVKMSVYYR